MVKIHVNLKASPQGQWIYYPGQQLSGTVQMDLSEPKKFRGFYVLISGVAKCHWTERRTRTVGSGKNRRTQSYTVSYDGKEVYINSKTYLFGHYGAEAVEIAAGIYTYNFAVDLPQLLPASLSGTHGSISYQVEAVIDIPWRFDKETHVPFTVLRHDNLNDNPNLRIPLKQDKVKSFCSLFCGGGKLMIVVSIPHGGFAVGHSIPVRIKYYNESDVEVECTRVMLNRTMSFTSSSPETKTKSDTGAVVVETAIGVKENKSEDFECRLNIPKILVNSNHGFCRVVQVSYFVSVESVVGGCHMNPEVKIPITIGSVAFEADNLSRNLPSAPQDPIPNNYTAMPQPAPSVAPSAPAMLDDVDLDLPPSFEEAMGNKELPQFEKSDFAQPPSSSIGWSVPTAPNDKM